MLKDTLQTNIQHHTYNKEIVINFLIIVSVANRSNNENFHNILRKDTISSFYDFVVITCLE